MRATVAGVAGGATGAGAANALALRGVGCCCCCNRRHRISSPPWRQHYRSSAAAASSARSEAAAADEARRRTAEALAARLPAARGADRPMLTKLQFMHSTQQLPDAFVGAVDLYPVPGRGWGLVATAVIEEGDPIVISPPLALVAGAPGQPPPRRALLAAVQGARWLAPARRLLEALADGDAPRAHDAAAASDEAARDAAAAAVRALSASEQREVAAAAAAMRLDGRDPLVRARIAQMLGFAPAFEEQERQQQEEDEGDDEDDDSEGAGGGAGVGADGRPPLLRELALGLSDAREEGRLASRLPLRIGRDRCATPHPLRVAAGCLPGCLLPRDCRAAQLRLPTFQCAICHQPSSLQSP